MEVIHYYCENRRITEEEAREIERRNKELFDSPEMTDWKKIRFIIRVRADLIEQ